MHCLLMTTAQSTCTVYLRPHHRVHAHCTHFPCFQYESVSSRPPTTQGQTEYRSRGRERFADDGEIYPIVHYRGWRGQKCRAVHRVPRSSGTHNTVMTPQSSLLDISKLIHNIRKQKIKLKLPVHKCTTFMYIHAYNTHICIHTIHTCTCIH